MRDPLGMTALVRHWNQERARRASVAASTTLGSPAVLFASLGEVVLTSEAPEVIVSRPELLFGALVEKGDQTDEGDIIIGVTPAWRRFLRELERDPNAFYRLDSRQFEELIAGGYEEEGWEVILTPRSGDGGKDIIATRPDFGTIRIIDQVKLYAAHREVDAEAVRSLYGVLSDSERAASKGIITTSSRFAPGIYTEFAHLIPSRITLRDGDSLGPWLLSDRGSDGA